VALKLSTAGNTVTVNRGGTDTINGSTTALLSVAGTGLQIAADTDGTPDNWTTLDFGNVADGSITLAKLASAVADALVPAGTIQMYGGDTLPNRYLFCDGSARSRTTYADLFTAIGTKYGSGDGSTTFNLPESRYLFPRGYGGIANVTGTGSVSSNNGTFTAHGYTKSGTKVRLSSGTLTGLSTSTDYFVIYVDANTLAFATTRANALAGTKIAISGTNSAVIMQWEDPDVTTRVASASGGATGDAVGSVQEQATARPSTSFVTGTESAGHTHTTTLDIGGNLTNGNIGSRYSTGIAFSQTSTLGTASGGVSANHTHTVTSGGDNETRPKNFSARFIIKF
jgi:microcystin-dependent protein